MLFVDHFILIVSIAIIAGGAYLYGRHERNRPRTVAQSDDAEPPSQEPDEPAASSATDDAGTSDALEDFHDSVSWLPDAIVILDFDLNLVWGNKIAEKWFGFSASEHAHTDVTRLIDSKDINRFIAGRGYPDSLECSSPENPNNTLRLRFLPYKHRQYLLQARDITQVRALETIRRDFIANASHELRTPVSILYGYLEMMLEKKQSGISSEWKRAIRQMHEQTHRIKQIIEDMMMLSRLENPDTSNMHETLDMTQLVRSVSHNAKILSGKKSHSINTHINSSHDLLGNRAEIESLLSNLVSNAIHYTPSGGKITIKWAVKSAQSTLSVADTGIGIDKEEIPRITERFYRIDTARSRDTGGTGLGLAIVHHIVNRHEAKLRIKSIPGKGSVFTVIFPAQRIQPNNQHTNLLFG